VQTVYDVVVDERGAVRSSTTAGEANGSGTIFTGVGVGEQEQRGALGACLLRRGDSW